MSSENNYIKNGFTLLELLVVVLIIGILSAIALPYYFNAVENARLTEIRLLWGRGKNYLVGRNFSADDMEKITAQLQKAKLNHFTAQLVCRNGSEPCWEIEFIRNENAAAHYQITSINNFAQLVCVPLNARGKSFCKSRRIKDGPISIEGKEAFIIQ